MFLLLAETETVLSRSEIDIRLVFELSSLSEKYRSGEGSGEAREAALQLHVTMQTGETVTVEAYREELVALLLWRSLIKVAKAIKLKGQSPPKASWLKQDIVELTLQSMTLFRVTFGGEALHAADTLQAYDIEEGACLFLQPYQDATALDELHQQFPEIAQMETQPGGAGGSTGCACCVA